MYLQLFFPFPLRSFFISLTIINRYSFDYYKTFNKGLNFRVFSKDKTKGEIHKGFYVLKVPKNTQAYFKVEL
ncbi:hypothetical protein HCCG_02280 [Helicobacter cinaedi CCUG 18818 = ATCC BAA-847]|uniref:Uncharacterized protein n=1 Tax=Helicobacter cinaedi CCUG 18818 = ATCC BAA-847 TaxID=537971 RepID=A0ABN0BE23_9HELI|nr:hypothetical protein HCCG_02280 [Helicobacter cinaedi CCUG 18818 = ATCC BAA-847]